MNVNDITGVEISSLAYLLVHARSNPKQRRQKVLDTAIAHASALLEKLCAQEVTLEARSPVGEARSARKEVVVKDETRPQFEEAPKPKEACKICRGTGVEFDGVTCGECEGTGDPNHIPF